MPAHDQVTLIKDMTYRGTLEEWSNTYMLDGTTPTTDAGWKTLFDAIIASEVKCYHNGVRVVRALGYVADSDAAAFSHDYLAAATTVPGTLVVTTGHYKWAGDQAGWLRARVGSSPNGKPKYIRKYFHGGSTDNSGIDAVSPQVKTNYLAHATKMLDGTLPGSMVWIGPNGVTGTTPAVSPYVTTRTLKRRGRRPTQPQPPA